MPHSKTRLWLAHRLPEPSAIAQEAANEINPDSIATNQIQSDIPREVASSNPLFLIILTRLRLSARWCIFMETSIEVGMS
jgi:hypothetical protein